ncbi:SGNH/GDSL hydrolase family protein [Sabulicella rubraurantiaca]|uniref:SGNH/GDSL hydrolase family protein n=1 Tax=Sabulicella rubraurantiaca TaxID=2811429 RepID=UPI001A965CD7|nr:SGNH/GDSL hydrolase family protein [Sabulicella rubraurantiaca]
MTHIVLAGDSVFDNGVYVPGQPDVVRQLRAALPAGAQASLVALDGAVVRDVPRQIATLPADTTHLVISAGGNDALSQEWMLGRPSRLVSDSLDLFADLRGAFRQDYVAMLDAALAQGVPVTACAIYDPRFPDADRQRRAVTALAFFNDIILRECFLRGIALLDLRLICSEAGDFANPIEPSAQGGEKIAAAIAAMALERSTRGARVVTGRS